MTDVRAAVSLGLGVLGGNAAHDRLWPLAVAFAGLAVAWLIGCRVMLGHWR